MAEDLNKEALVAQHLLHRGARMKMRAPLFLRWFGKKTIGLTVRSPYEGTMHRVAAYYLSTGIKSEQLNDISHEDALALWAAHGQTICKAVACAWLNGYWAGKLFTKPLAWYILWHCKPQELFNMTTIILLYGGTADFINTTRSVRMMKMTTPTKGQKTQGS